MRYLIIIISLVLFAACQNKNIAYDFKPEDLTYKSIDTYEKLIGRWLGRIQTKSGTDKRWLSTFKPDGTYHIEFRHTKSDGTTNNQHQVGHWGFSGGIQFTTTRAVSDSGDRYFKVDPSDHYNHNTYKLLSVTNSNFSYQSLVTGTQYTVEKVADDYSWD